MPKKINGTILSGYVIVLERNGLAVKKGGIIKDSEFLPYSSITSVSVDCPLIGTGTITFYLGLRKVVAHGFTRGQAKEIQSVINAGYYDDAEDVSLANNSNMSYSEDATTSAAPVHHKTADEIRAEAELKRVEEEAKAKRRAEEAEAKRRAEEAEAKRRAEEIAETKNALNEIQALVEVQDEKIMLTNLNKLATIIDTSEGDVKKAAQTSFEIQLKYLKAISPKHPMIKLFQEKLDDSKGAMYKMFGKPMKKTLWWWPF